MTEINHKILQQIGLTDHEIKVYLTLLKLGSSPVSAIAQHSKTYRPYVYDTLKRLLEKGLVNYVSKSDKKHFQAVHPDKLLEGLKEKQLALESILPSLIDLTKLPREETKMELYKGKEVVRIVIKDIMKTLEKEGGENLVLGVDEKKFVESDPIILKQLFAHLKRIKCKEKLLVREGDNYLPGPRETTEYRFIPKEFFNPTSTHTYGNKIAIIIFGEPLHGLIIESKQLAEAYRKQFYLLWNQAKKK